MTGFLDRLLLGTALDEVGNHDDDSLLEISSRCAMRGDNYTRRKLEGIHDAARQLRKRFQ
ncbi:hypothetical protein AQ938_06870 [Burkholderia pseudomallei]|nr:hypothetical protein AQ938_06870 [Burkholderia pseudomallei]